MEEAREYFAYELCPGQRGAIRILADSLDAAALMVGKFLGYMAPQIAVYDTAPEYALVEIGERRYRVVPSDRIFRYIGPVVCGGE